MDEGAPRRTPLLTGCDVPIFLPGWGDIRKLGAAMPTCGSLFSRETSPLSESATIRSEHTVGRNLGSLGAPRLNSRHQSRSPVPLPCGKITDPAARYPSKLPAFARDG